MKKIGLVILSILMFLPMQTYALSLVFSAGECIEPANNQATTPSYRLIESKFKLVVDNGNGFYRLELTGGLPRFSDNSNDLCIDTERSLGYIGFPKANNPDTYLPKKQDSLIADAYFDGKTLIIFTSTIYTDKTGKADYTRNHVQSSMFVPISRSLFFNYDATSNSFRMTRMLKSAGMIIASAVSVPEDTYLEVSIPGFFETYFPKMDIVYKLIDD